MGHTTRPRGHRLLGPAPRANTGLTRTRPGTLGPTFYRSARRRPGPGRHRITTRSGDQRPGSGDQPGSFTAGRSVAFPDGPAPRERPRRASTDPALLTLPAGTPHANRATAVPAAEGKRPAVIQCLRGSNDSRDSRGFISAADSPPRGTSSARRCLIRHRHRQPGASPPNDGRPVPTSRILTGNLLRASPGRSNVSAGDGTVLDTTTGTGKHVSGARGDGLVDGVAVPGTGSYRWEPPMGTDAWQNGTPAGGRPDPGRRHRSAFGDFQSYEARTEQPVGGLRTNGDGGVGRQIATKRCPFAGRRARSAGLGHQWGRTRRSAPGRRRSVAGAKTR